jgi:ATP-dependent RNA helicase SUPV3L1/SUV3
MKTLEQEGRAALRRLGVRFGAYHVFVPSLIKPAPAGLITLLWALKNDGKEKPGFGDVVHALASGRTSVVIDPAFDPAFYKLAGYRNLGRRAVRIDILERLADLIRPATNWKPGLGPRPEGAYDGQAFMVTPPMMSILGANADDMEEILKGLGYRAEPKPAAEVKARLEAQDNAAREAEEARQAADEAARAEQAKAAEASATEADVEVSAEAMRSVAEEAPVAEAAEVALEETQALEMQAHTPADVVEEEPSVAEPVAETPIDAAPAEEAEAAPVEAAASVEAAEAVAAVDEAPVESVEVAAEAAAPEMVTEISTPDIKAEDAAAEEQPKPILLWRQARFERPRGNHRHDNRPRGGQARNAQAAGERAPGGQTGEADKGKGRPRFDRSRYKGKPADGQQAESRSHGKPRGERRDGRPEGKGGAQAKPAFQPKPREERPVRFDPDSPFAKLAALRDQLKK